MDDVQTIDETCDVLIIGAGTAGACLARQLRLEHPELSVMMVERKKQFDWWVGESLTEPFDDYAVRVLGLGPYLMHNYMPKHSLRFFFDSPEHDLQVHELSEIGRGPYAGSTQSFQVDRARFDTDLVEMNRKLGVKVMLGVRVLGRGGETDKYITLDREKGHVVQTTAGAIRCKWLVDAGGRNSPLTDMLDLVSDDTKTDPRHVYWGRFGPCKSIDGFGDDAWRRRVDYSLRFLSTNHFMYHGYWMWQIPVSDTVTSWGLAFDAQIKPELHIRNQREFEAFLRKHTAINQLMDKAECLDFMGIKYMNRCASQFFSEDRWFLTGMSAMFIDPLFSTGSVILAFMNRFISAIIAADKVGDKVRFSRRVKHFNRYLEKLYSSIRAGMRYDRFGSFDAFVGFHTGRFQTYWNQDVASQMSDFRAFIASVDATEDEVRAEPGRELAKTPGQGRAGGVIGAIDSLTDQFVAFAQAEGKYYERNKGCFFENSERWSLRWQAFSRKPQRESQRKENDVTYESIFRHFVTRMCAMSGVRFSEECFQKSFDRNWRADQPLKDVFEAMKAWKPTGKEEAPPRIRWTPKGPVDPDAPRTEVWEPLYVGPDDESLW